MRISAAIPLCPPLLLLSSQLRSALSVSAAPRHLAVADLGSDSDSAAVFYFLVRRFFFLRSRSCPSLPCFAGQA